MTTLLVASTGGHLAELHDLAPRLGIGARRWVTFDSPQSRSLLAGEDVTFVPPATSRDVVGVLQDLRVARRMLRAGRYERVISTGASVAMAFFVPAVAAGIECFYIESATRTEGPSLTGRLAARLPGVRLYTQYPAWANHRWQYGGSIFDAFEAEALTEPPPIRKVVVTLGTHERYTFPRLLTRLVDLLPPEWEVLWQVGATVVDRMPAGARRQVPIDEMRLALAAADVVVSHAGVGSALAAMQAGKRSLYVPRRKAHGEHVDDHQVAMARELEGRKLVVAREVEELTLADLHTAAGWTVRATPGVTPFRMATR
ncbi:glycosyltransferase [Actinoplanes sp. N902-109]|uniref:glycosyltransferase n=1 Tax=Actinoplanes sp. (strain N902-109) TaxID=649831 RepID=UPI0003293767|nr:glycosyltransferase [Actinoplanes sp. N902-109]AGL19987.1 glycosyltransferase 28 domain protein [Actinoplanes sp. N902-109]